MDSFLTRFYEDTRRWLGDPTQFKRLTKAQMIEDFYDAERDIWEQVLNATGIESLAGRAEATVNIVADQEFYPFPGNFRQFLRLRRYSEKTVTVVAEFTGASYVDTGGGDGEFEITSAGTFSDYCRRAGDTLTISAPAGNAGTYTVSKHGASSNGDDVILLTSSAGADASGTITGKITRTVPDRRYPLGFIGSINDHEPGPGIIPLEAQRGFELRPMPTEASSWLMVYQKGPVRLHNATAAAVSANTLTGGTPATNNGEVIATDGYYTGSLVRVYSATTGYPQTNEVTDYASEIQRFGFRYSWPITPTGTVLYEICPVLDLDHDKFYAMKVAEKNSIPRRNMLWKELTHRLHEKKMALLKYYLSNVKDRGPQKPLPVDNSEADPYDGIVDYDWVWR